MFNERNSMIAVILAAMVLLFAPDLVFAQSPQAYHYEFPTVVVQDGAQTGASVTVPMILPPAPVWTKRVTIEYSYGGNGPIKMENTAGIARPAGNFDVGCPVSFRHGTTPDPFDGNGYTYIYNYPSLAAYDGECDGQGSSGMSWNVNGLHPDVKTYTGPYDLALWRRFDRGGAHWLFVTAKPEVMTWPSTVGHGWYKFGFVVFSYPNGFTITYYPN